MLSIFNTTPSILVPTTSVDHPDHNWQVTTTNNGYTITQQEAKQVQDTSTPSSLDSVNTAINNINEKMVATSEALRSCMSVEESIRYCELLKSCAEALRALRDVERI
jgi:UDP-N-acetylglucosamine:LPS N-acetylglucosamine transferase